MTATMMLEANSPAWLEARIDAGDARKVLKAAESRVEHMLESNRLHAAEVKEKARTGPGPLLTNGQTARRGSGSGTSTIYTRCNCDGFIVECTHDPTESPHPDQALADAEKAIGRARTALDKAEKRLAATDPSFDCVAAARDAGSEYVWWPLSKYTDPRRNRYRGLPLSDLDVEALGPHRLVQAVNSGSIVKVL